MNSPCSPGNLWLNQNHILTADSTEITDKTTDFINWDIPWIFRALREICGKTIQTRLDFSPFVLIFFTRNKAKISVSGVHINNQFYILFIICNRYISASPNSDTVRSQDSSEIGAGVFFYDLFSNAGIVHVKSGNYYF